MKNDIGELQQMNILDDDEYNFRFAMSFFCADGTILHINDQSSIVKPSTLEYGAQ